MAYINADIKGLNRKIVYDLLLCNAGISRADISRMTGISAPTVLKIVEYLENTGCVREIGEGKAPLGRKPCMLQFDAGFGYAIGVNFSGVGIDVGIVDFAGTIRYMGTFPAVADLGKVMNEILPLQIKSCIEASGVPADRIRGICIGLPGVVNPEDKTLGLAPLVGVSDRMEYSGYISTLSDRLAMPVRFENDANMAAVGEFKARKGSCGDDLLFITIGKGLGAGLILDGRLRTGPRYFAGELGYMVFDSTYRSAENTAGWLETAIQLDRFRQKTKPTTAEIDKLAGFLALAIGNICMSVDMATAVLGKFGDDEFYQALVRRINYYLQSFCKQAVLCTQPVSAEPTVSGSAQVIIDSEIDRMFKA